MVEIVPAVGLAKHPKTVSRSALLAQSGQQWYTKLENGNVGLRA
jgi:hypothetical protein